METDRAGVQEGGEGSTGCQIKMSAKPRDAPEHTDFPQLSSASSRALTLEVPQGFLSSRLKSEGIFLEP